MNKVVLSAMASLSMAGVASVFGADYPNPVCVDVAKSVTLTLSEALAASGAGCSVQSLDGGEHKDWTIVKRGAGTLHMDVAITNYTGAIHVEEGLLKASCYYALGSGNSGALESATFVHGDGSLYFTSDAATVDPVEGERIVIEGDGYSDWYGSLRCYNTDKNVFWGLGRYLTLSSDTKIVYEAHPTTTRRMGFKGAGDYAQTVDMNGHTLTVEGASGRNRPYFTFWGYTGGREPGPQFFSNAGSIIATNITMMVQYDMTFDGDASNRMTLQNSRMGLMTERNTHIPWTLEAQANSGILGGETARGALSCVTNVGQWHGPVLLSANVSIGRWSANSDFHSHVSLKGKVSGDGGFRPVDNSGQSEKIALHLVNPENDFKGGVVMSGGILYAGGNGTIPSDGGAVVMTNSVLHFCGNRDENLELPSLELNGSASVVGGKGAWRGSVSKTGAGTSIYSSSAGGGLLDVREGTLRFPKYRTGLYQGENTYGPGTQARHCLNRAFTNRVVCTPEMAYATFESGSWSTSNTLYTYSGTIWNHGEDADWTFASSVFSAYVELDGVEVLKAAGAYNWSQRYATNNTVRVTKGPHKIHIAVASIQHSSGWGENMLYAYDKNKWTWDTKSGIMVDRQGRGSKNVANYERLEDPGDGSLFTLDSVLDDSWLPAFERLNVDSGAVLDLQGHSYQVQDVSGCGTIVDGDVSVGRAFVVDSRSAADGGTLSFGGRLVFAEGAKFSALADGMDVSRTVKENGWLAAYAEGGIEGMPEPDDSARRNWGVSKTADGKGLFVRYFGSFAVILR